MPAAWPDTLPQRFLVEGNSHALGENRLETSMDTGPGKIRPRSSAVADQFTGSMRMSSAQWATLIAFGETTLGHWSLPFTVPSIDDGADPWLVRFKAKPSRANIGGDRWNVSMSLEVLP